MGIVVPTFIPGPQRVGRENVLLSKHFWLSEAVRSNKVSRWNAENPNDQIDNWPTDPEVLFNLKAVAENILEPMRAQFGPIHFTGANSWYRGPRLNAMVGSKPVSQHLKGEAVDIEIPGVPNADLFQWCMEKLPEWDELLAEFISPYDPNEGWIHISYSRRRPNRRMINTMVMGDDGKYIKLAGPPDFYSVGTGSSTA